MIRRAVGRLILWFTDAVTPRGWQPWPYSDEAAAELSRLRAARNRAIFEQDEKTFKHVR